jgi:hypothetical protein
MLVNLSALTAAHQRRNVLRFSGRDRLDELFITGTIHREYQQPGGWHGGMQLRTKLFLSTPHDYLRPGTACLDEKHGGHEQDQTAVSDQA